jgi:hypothetical protein
MEKKIVVQYLSAHEVLGHKKPRTSRGFWNLKRIAAATSQLLLDFGFFVDHVLTHYWIILLHLQLIGRRTLVLVSGIKVASSRRRYHSDFISHSLTPSVAAT